MFWKVEIRFYTNISGSCSENATWFAKNAKTLPILTCKLAQLTCKLGLPILLVGSREIHDIANHLQNSITLRLEGVWRSSLVFWKAGIALYTIFSESCSENATWFAKKRRKSQVFLQKMMIFRANLSKNGP